MTGSIDRRVVLPVIVAALLLTAGCASNGSPTPSVASDATATETEAPTAAASPTAEATETEIGTTETAAETTATASTVGAGTESHAANGYVFSQGETYTYTLASEDVEFVWRTVDVSGDGVTVEVVTEAPDGETTTQTYTGNQTDSGNTLFTETTIGLFETLRDGVTITDGHSLEAGASWTITQDELPRVFGPDWETGTAEVTDAGSYDGVSYYNVTVSPDSMANDSVTFSVNGEYPFALAWSSEGISSTEDTGVIVLDSADR